MQPVLVLSHPPTPAPEGATGVPLAREGAFLASFGEEQPPVERREDPPVLLVAPVPVVAPLIGDQRGVLRDGGDAAPGGDRAEGPTVAEGAAGAGLDREGGPVRLRQVQDGDRLQPLKPAIALTGSPRAAVAEGAPDSGQGVAVPARSVALPWAEAQEPPTGQRVAADRSALAERTGDPAPSKTPDRLGTVVRDIAAPHRHAADAPVTPASPTRVDRADAKPLGGGEGAEVPLLPAPARGGTADGLDVAQTPVLRDAASGHAGGVRIHEATSAAPDPAVVPEGPGVSAAETPARQGFWERMFTTLAWPSHDMGNVEPAAVLRPWVSAGPAVPNPGPGAGATIGPTPDGEPPTDPTLADPSSAVTHVRTTATSAGAGQPDSPVPPSPATAAGPELTDWLAATLDRGGKPDETGVQVFSTGAVGAPSLPTGPSAALAASAVPQAGVQMAAALARSADGATELALSPEELGQVRLRLEPDPANPDRMVVMITVERPETLDLFRRHATELADALRGAGYADAEIGFGQDSGGQEGSDHAGDRPATVPAIDRDLPGPALPQPPAPRLVAGASLDLRL